MRRLKSVLRRFRAMLRRGRLERELAEEMKFHREMSERELVADGVGEEEAKRVSRRRLGGTLRWAEESREAWGWPWIESLIQDLRFGLRQLIKSPAFTVTAIVSLGIGVGATTAVFTIVNSVLLKPLPGRDPGSLASIYTSDFSGPPLGTSSYVDYQDFREQATSFADIAGYSWRSAAVEVGEDVERAFAELVTANYFDVLGVGARYGRTFLPEEGEDPGAHAVVVLGHSYWKTRFGGDPGIVGQTVRVNGRPFDVIGIAAEGFGGMLRGVSSDLYVPTAMAPELFGESHMLTNRSSRALFLLGRLRSGAQAESAQEELRVIAAGLHRAYPEAWEDVRESPRRVTVLPEDESRLMPGSQTAVLSFLTLLALIALAVLLTACLNVANLLLIRAADRGREIALRLSLGAGRRRLARQLATESALLFVLAGSLGLLIAFAAVNALTSFQPPLPVKIDLELDFDYRTLLFGLGLSLLTGVAFGLAPAANALRADLRAKLVGAGSGHPGGAKGSAMRNAFVVSQVALSTVLLIAAGLFLRSLDNAGDIDVGFDPDGVVTAAVDLDAAGYGESEGRLFFENLRARLEASPQIISAGYGQSLPLGLDFGRTSVVIEDYEPGPGEDMEQHHSYVGPGYFETMRIPIVLGRPFSERDTENSPGVAVVNEAFVRRYLPGRNPIGARMARGLRSSEAAKRLPLEIVGVAKDGKYLTLGEDPRPYVYFPHQQMYRGEMYFVARSRGASEETARLLRSEIRAVNEALPVFVATLDDSMSVSLLPARVAASVASSLGSAAVLLAALGLYGVTAYSVRTRIKELGLRAAIGARPDQLIRLIVRRGMTLTAVGLAAGVVGALAVSRLASFLLYGVRPTDPPAFLAAAGVLTAAGLAACLAPAWRAGRADPMQVLRYE